jgi:hypothetical protein
MYSLFKGFWSNLVRLFNPKRKEADLNSEVLFSEIIKDFKKYDKDLRKVKIINHGGNIFNFSQISIGHSYTLSYVFGKYHPVYRDFHIGNRDNYDRRVKIHNIKFSFTILKNELENFFNTSRLTIPKANIEVEKTTPNLDGSKHHRNERKSDKYVISSDLANKLFDYFNNQFDEQYPILKGTKYKGSMEIRDIKKGVNPVVKHNEIVNKYGETIYYSIRFGEDEKIIRNMLYNTRKSDYDVAYKQHNDVLYKSYHDKKNIKDFQILSKISDILKKHSINLDPKEFKYGIGAEFGFGKALVYEHEIVIEFCSTDSEIVEKVDGLLKDLKDIDGYVYSYKRIFNGYNDDRKYVLLQLDHIDYIQ